MIEIAICDDVREDAIKLQSYMDDKLFEISCEIFESAKEFFSKEKEYDVVFLDCKMPGMSGEEMAEQLRERHVESLLVFFTGSREPTPDIFRLQPFRYLLKDMSPEKLRREVKEILEKCRERKVAYYIYGRDVKDIIKIPVHEISYIEIAKHGSVIHVIRDGVSHEYTVKENIRELGKRLEDSGFAQPHNSYLVSLDHIASYGKTYISMIGGTQLSVSRAYRKKFDSVFQRFMINGR